MVLRGLVSLGELSHWLGICFHEDMRRFMKKYVLYLVLASGVATMSSCIAYSQNGNNHVPPGKAKKIVGTKSAKPFAPGQRKKRGKRKVNHTYDLRYPESTPHMRVGQGH